MSASVIDLSALRLRGDGLALRPFALDDAEAVLAAASDPAMDRWLALSRPLRALTDVHAWVLDGLSMAMAGRGVRLAVCEDNSGELLGCVELQVFDNGAGAVGYWTVPGARGCGVARRAAKLLTDWALGSGGLWAVDLLTLPGNAASERVALAAGFAPDGEFRCFDARVGDDVTFNVFARVRRTD